MNLLERREWFNRTGGVTLDSDSFREEVADIKLLGLSNEGGL